MEGTVYVAKSSANPINKTKTTKNSTKNNYNGRRLTFRRSWVRIPALYSGWTFFDIYLL